MRCNHISKAIFASTLFCMFIFSIVISTEAIPNEKEATEIISNGETVFSFSDTIFLYYEEFWALSPTNSYDKPYGFRYSFSTSPLCDMTVYTFDMANFEDWYYGYSHTKHVKQTDAVSGSGTFRFDELDYWVIIFWHTDSYQSSTTLSWSLSVEKMAPLGLIVGLIIGGVVVVGIALCAVIGTRRRKKTPTYPATYSGPSSGVSYGYQVSTEQRLLQLAVVEFQKGNAPGAINLFQQTLRVNPNSLAAISGLGVAYLAIKDYNQSKFYLEKTVMMNPTDHKARELLTIATAMAGQSAVSPSLPTSSTPVQESEIKSTICKNCGSTLESADDFCPFCGEAN